MEAQAPSAEIGTTIKVPRRPCIPPAKLIARDRWDKAAVDARSADLLSWAKTQWKD